VDTEFYFTALPSDFSIAFWFTLFYCLHQTSLMVDWSMSEKLLQHAGEEVMFQI